MRLSSKALSNVDSVNALSCADCWTTRQDGCVGEATNLYFQVVDLDRKGCSGPLRYIPIGSVITMTVSFPNLDENSAFSVPATQPFAQDQSVFMLSLSTKNLPSSGAVQFKLQVDAQVWQWSVQNMMQVEMLNSGNLAWSPRRGPGFL